MLLRQGRPTMEARASANDMISVAEAAGLVGESVTTIRRWISDRHCFAVATRGRVWRLPYWQFDVDLLPWIGPVCEALGATSGWQVLWFLETPHGGLDGRTPRAALEQGDVCRVLMVATV